MVLCGLCKKEIDESVEWILRDVTPSSTVADEARVCGSCASRLVGTILSEMRMSPEDPFHMTSVFGGIRFKKGTPQVILRIGLEDAKKKISR